MKKEISWLNYVEIPLAEQCNLNCAGCSHFSPLAEIEFADSEVVRNDLHRLSTIFNGKIRRVRFLGGEPLLHRDLNTILCDAKAVLPYTDIQIVTNGINLMDIDESFFTVCFENRIGIHVTQYPISFDYNAVAELVKSKNIKLTFASNSNVEQKTFHHLVIDEKGGHDAEKNFRDYCTCSDCTNLSNGKLYLCPVRASIRHLISYFGMHINLSDSDYLDIHDREITDSDIIAFISHPCSFCSYCNCEKITYGHMWKCSERLLEEWT